MRFPLLDVKKESLLETLTSVPDDGDIRTKHLGDDSGGHSGAIDSENHIPFNLGNGGIHTIYGPPFSGKSKLLMHVVINHRRSSASTVIIDLEARYDLGLQLDSKSESIVFIQPSDSSELVSCIDSIASGKFLTSLPDPGRDQVENDSDTIQFTHSFSSSGSSLIQVFNLSRFLRSPLSLLVIDGIASCYWELAYAGTWHRFANKLVMSIELLMKVYGDIPVLCAVTLYSASSNLLVEKPDLSSAWPLLPFTRSVSYMSLRVPFAVRLANTASNDQGYLQTSRFRLFEYGAGLTAISNEFGFFVDDLSIGFEP
ncbi:hypothetical protein V1511DRAFT_494366 [Dipodascopsis uninucleata]